VVDSDVGDLWSLDTVVDKFAQRGIDAVLVGMNPHAERLHASTTGQVSAH
jgi:SulP family sulfate permease